MSGRTKEIKKLAERTGVEVSKIENCFFIKISQICAEKVAENNLSEKQRNDLFTDYDIRRQAYEKVKFYYENNKNIN